MIRAVLDTNVAVSALLFGGRASMVVPAWKRRQFTWLVSQALLSEYIRVLHYPKFHLSREEIRALLEEEILPHITPVKVSRTPRVVRMDPADDHVLACAAAGRADLIVTGDHHLLDLAQYRTIPIITIPAFVHRLGLSH